MLRSASSVTVVLALCSACYTGGKIDFGSSSPATSVSPTNPATADAALPCDVAALLSESCGSCHGSPLAGGAPNELLTAADLAAPSKLDPSKTVADDALARMKSASQPMPPSGLLASDRVAVLANWISDGMPPGSCDTPASKTPTDTPTVCSSNKHWTRGDHGSTSMHPGGTCIDCHSSSDDGPLYRIAGTVYPTAHEPDDCNGASGDITVVITDGNGKTYSLPVNSAGNFFSASKITLPYTAKVVSGGQERAMSTAQRNGDCNSCHTEQGTESAPGRIMAP